MLTESVLPPPVFRLRTLGERALRAPRGRRIAGRVGTWALLGAVVVYLVVPQVTGAGNSWQLLLEVDHAWLLVAVGMEVASLAVYAALTRAMLPRLERPGYATVLGIDLATLAASNVVPGARRSGSGWGTGC